MARVTINESTLTDIGDAIRTKTGGSALIDPADMATEIADIPSGATLTTKNITANGTYNASDDNADGYSSVIVAVGDIDMSVTADQYKLLVEPYVADHSVTISFLQTVANGCTIDWGDGMSETSGSHTYDEFIVYSNNLYTHIYTDAKPKCITVTANDGIIYLYGAKYASGSCIVTPPSVAPSNTPGVAEYNNYYKGMLRQVAVGDNIVLNANKSDFVWGTFVGLPHVVSNRYFDFGITVIPTQVRNSMILGDVVIPDGVTTILTYALIGITCDKMVFPESIRTIEASAFSGSRGIQLYDFTATRLIDGQFPITLAHTNAFNQISTFQKIMFATQEIAEAAKAATNWSTYASRIHYVGE